MVMKRTGLAVGKPVIVDSLDALKPKKELVTIYVTKTWETEGILKMQAYVEGKKASFNLAPEARTRRYNCFGYTKPYWHLTLEEARDHVAAMGKKLERILENRLNTVRGIRDSIDSLVVTEIPTETDP